MENEFYFENSEFVSLDLLNEEQLRSKVNSTVQILQSNVINRITSFINYLRIITRTNYFVSGLNTNFIMKLTNNDDTFSLYGRWVQFYQNDLLTVVTSEETCGNGNPTRPSGFYYPALGNCILNSKKKEKNLFD